jgi:hypothetical protein
MRCGAPRQYIQRLTSDAYTIYAQKKQQQQQYSPLLFVHRC